MTDVDITKFRMVVGRTRELEGWDGLILTRSLDNFGSTLTFNNPIDSSTRDIIRNTTVDFYYDTSHLFSGVIKEIGKSVGKTARKFDFRCVDYLGYLKEVNLPFSFSPVNLEFFINNIVTATNQVLLGSLGTDTDGNPLLSFTPETNGTGVLSELRVDVNFDKNVGNMFEQLHKNNALYVYFKAPNTISFNTPTFLREQNVFTGIELNENSMIGDINVADTTANVNGIVVMGFANMYVGVAIDFLSVSLNNGIINYEIVYDWNIFDQETAESQAQQILLDRARNYILPVNIPLLEETLNIYQGDLLKINTTDTDLSDIANKFFIAKKNMIKINKASQELSAELEMFNFTLTEIPSDLVFGTTGIADIDVALPSVKTNRGVSELLGWVS